MSHVFELTGNFRSVCTLHLLFGPSSIRIVYLAGIRKHRHQSRDLPHANVRPRGCESPRLLARFERRRCPAEDGKAGVRSTPGEGSPGPLSRDRSLHFPSTITERREPPRRTARNPKAIPVCFDSPGSPSWSSFRQVRGHTLSHQKEPLPWPATR